MSSPEEKSKKRRRLQHKRKKDFRVRSPQAKALEESQYRQRVVKDKRGKEHNLDELTHADLIKAINEQD